MKEKEIIREILFKAFANVTNNMQIWQQFAFVIVRIDSLLYNFTLDITLYIKISKYVIRYSSAKLIINFYLVYTTLLSTLCLCYYIKKMT